MVGFEGGVFDATPSWFKLRLLQTSWSVSVAEIKGRTPTTTFLPQLAARGEAPSNMAKSPMPRFGGVLCSGHAKEHQALLDLCDEATALSRHNWRQRKEAALRKIRSMVR